VLFNHAPEGARIGRADRFAFKQDGRAAFEQRAIDYVGMTHYPADIGRGPEHFALLDAIDRFHRPVQRHHMPAIVAHHTFGLAGGA